MAKKQRQDSGPDAGLIESITGLTPAATYQQRKAQADQERVRLRVDVPAWLKASIEAESKSARISMSQLGAFLLAYALKAYKAGDPDLVAMLEGAKYDITHLRWSHGLDLSDLGS